MKMFGGRMLDRAGRGNEATASRLAVVAAWLMLAAHGAYATDGVAYRENVITNNTMGTVLGGVNLFSSSCNGTAACPR